MELRPVLWGSLAAFFFGALGCAHGGPPKSKAVPVSGDRSARRVCRLLDRSTKPSGRRSSDCRPIVLLRCPRKLASLICLVALQESIGARNAWCSCCSRCGIWMRSESVSSRCRTRGCGSASVWSVGPATMTISLGCQEVMSSSECCCRLLRRAWRFNTETAISTPRATRRSFATAPRCPRRRPRITPIRPQVSSGVSRPVVNGEADPTDR
jgi:hypothetical protein